MVMHHLWSYILSQGYGHDSPNTCNTNSSDVFRVRVAKACSFTGSNCSIDHGLSCGHLLT